jgi:hypothetical protein
MNTQEAFVHHMNAMREHHKSGATHTYSMPVDLLYSDAENDSGLYGFTANDSDGGTEVTAALKDYKTDTDGFVDNQKSGAQSSVNTLKVSGKDSAATKAFIAAMNKQKAEAKKKSDAIIDKNYEKLINVGIKHPAQQKRILSVTQQIGAFFTNLLSSVGDFFENLGKSIVNFFKNVGEWFSNAGKSIANWTTGAVHSVGHFFSSIF